MAKMYLYNGVELPALPEWDTVWNPEVYKYLFITATTTGYDLDAWSAVPVNNSTVGKIHPANDCKGFSWYHSDGAWQRYKYDGDNPTSPKASLNYSQPMWTNTDILNEDGSLYLAASEPVPVLSIDHTAMVQGWIVGKRLAAMRKREPVAYLYNGVRLPKLPEWDKVTYPYVYMTKSKPLGLLMYAVTAASVPAKYTPYENNPTHDGALLPISDGAKYISITYTESGGDWKVSEEKDYTGTVVSDTSVPIWTNTDIYNEGGTLYLAASEPAPVYE